MFSRQAKHFLIAFRYLSFLSADRSLPQNPEELGRSSSYFPLVGFILGVGLMIFYFLLSKVLNEEVVCLLVLIGMFLFCKGRQYKACLVFFDYIAAADDPRESASPAFHPESDAVRIAALFFLFMLKFLALTHIGQGWVLGILVLMPTFSCWSRVYLSHSLGFTAVAKTDRYSYLRSVRSREFWGATFLTTVPAVLVLELKGLFLLLFVSLWTALFERFFLPKREEVVDAALGTAMELNEISMLMAAIVMQKGFAMATTKGIWL